MKISINKVTYKRRTSFLTDEIMEEVLKSTRIVYIFTFLYFNLLRSTYFREFSLWLKNVTNLILCRLFFEIFNYFEVSTAIQFPKTLHKNGQNSSVLITCVNYLLLNTFLQLLYFTCPSYTYSVVKNIFFIFNSAEQTIDM